MIRAARVRLHHEALVEYSWDVRTGIALFGYENPPDFQLRTDERAQRRWWLTPEQRDALRREKERITGEAKRRAKKGDRRDRR